MSSPLGKSERRAGSGKTFMGRMSHEFRTPLNAIVGFTELLEQEHFGPLTERQKCYVSHILESSHHLLALVNDLLDVAELETGTLRLEKRWQPVLPVLEQAVSAQRDRARTRGLELALSHSLVEEERWRVDASRIGQVLGSLLQNAIQHTDPGGRIEVHAERVNSQIEVSVSDTGSGIEQEHLARLFRRFEDVEPYGDSAIGPGRGLVLVRELVELHGGHVDVESDPGSGSTFSLRVPIDEPRSDPQAPRMVLQPGGDLDCLVAPLEAAGFEFRSEGERERAHDLLVIEESELQDTLPEQTGQILVIPELERRAEGHISLPEGFYLRWSGRRELHDLRAALQRLLGEADPGDAP